MTGPTPMTVTGRLLEIRAYLLTSARQPWPTAQLFREDILAAAEDIATLVEDIELAKPGTVTSASLVPSTWVGDEPDPDIDYDDRMADRAARALGPEGMV